VPSRQPGRPELAEPASASNFLPFLSFLLHPRSLTIHHSLTHSLHTLLSFFVVEILIHPSSVTGAASAPCQVNRSPLLLFTVRLKKGRATALGTFLLRFRHRPLPAASQRDVLDSFHSFKIHLNRLTTTTAASAIARIIFSCSFADKPRFIAVDLPVYFTSSISWADYKVSRPSLCQWITSH
jgi:hypothetical protein